MQTGAVKWLSDAEVATNGFKSLQENQRIEFLVIKGKKGLQASNIQLL